MPTAEEYSEAATTFRQRAEHLAREAGAQLAWQRASYLGDGPPRAAIDASLELARRAIADAADEMAALATECDRRASICEAYRRAVRFYWQLPYLVRLVTAYPARPAYWADP